MTLIQYEEHNFRRKSLQMIEIINTVVDDYETQDLQLSARQIYYILLTMDLYSNTTKSYNMLKHVLKNGRMAGLISWDAIVDREREFKNFLIEEDQLEVLDGIEYQFALDHWRRQNTYVEVWVEKKALVGVIEKPCRKFRTPFIACKGFMSSSELWRAGQRFLRMENEGRKCVLIHLGDHDPSGKDMTRDNRERVELFSHDSNVEVRRIALNMDQVEEYRLKPDPAKMSDSRAKDYVAEYGNQSWELDALNPRTLSDLISGELQTLIDDKIWQDTVKVESQGREHLSQLHDRWDEIKKFLDKPDEEYE